MTCFHDIAEIEIEVRNCPYGSNARSTFWMSVQIAMLVNSLNDCRTEDRLSAAGDTVKPQERVLCVLPSLEVSSLNKP